MFDDWFSGDSGGYEVAESYGGPQEDVVWQEYSNTGTLGAWEEARGAAIVQESLGQQIVAASLSEYADAQAVGAAISSAGSDYASRLAEDLARFGISVASAALPTVTGAALSTPRLPQARPALFDWNRNQTTNTGFGPVAVLLGGLVLIGGAYVVGKAL